MSLHRLSFLLFVFMFFSILQSNIPSRGSVDIGDDPQSSLDTFLDTCVSLRRYLSYFLRSHIYLTKRVDDADCISIVTQFPSLLSVLYFNTIHTSKRLKESLHPLYFIVTTTYWSSTMPWFVNLLQLV